jgi:hypothetical protein
VSTAPPLTQDFVPTTDGEVQDLITRSYSQWTGKVLHDLYRIHRLEGLTILNAWKATLLAYLEATGDQGHCPTCICGRRAPVQADRAANRGPGTITWAEHLTAWSAYAARYGDGQSAERLAERGGFGWGELVVLLKHEPATWRPRGGDS